MGKTQPRVFSIVYAFKLNYVEVPFFIVFDSWGIPFEIGPTFSYLINFEGKR